MKLATPEEHEAARSLVNWLEGDRDQDVDTDILEAIYVLSPENCPEPRVGLEQIISSVEFGPFGTKVEADGSVDDAEYLRELLSHSAPVPQTSLEMILAQVEAGPFAEEAQFEAEERLEEELPDNVVRPRAWWQRTEIAVASAAALALLILIPSNFEIPEQEMAAAALDQELSEEKSLAEDAQVVGQKVQRAKRSSTVDVSVSLEKPFTKEAKALEVQKPSLKPKRQEAQFQTNTPAVLVEKKLKRTDELMTSSLVVRAKDEVNVGEMNKLEILAKSDSEKKGLQEQVTGPPIIDSEILDIEEIIVADADFADEMDEAILESTSKRLLDRKRQDFTSEVSGSQSSPSTKESLSENEDPVSVMAAETYEKRSIANTVEFFDQTVPEASEEEVYDMGNEARIQQIVELLSATEKQEIQKLRTSAEIVNYAQKFSATKSLAILWQGAMNRDNSFAIELLKYSIQFPSGQKKYLQRNYQLLISLLAQEGQDSEAEVYRQKLDSLK